MDEAAEKKHQRSVTVVREYETATPGRLHLFHILPMKPDCFFASCMLCLRATEAGSSLPRFWAARLAKRPADACVRRHCGQLSASYSVWYRANGEIKVRLDLPYDR